MVDSFIGLLRFWIKTVFRFNTIFKKGKIFYLGKNARLLTSKGGKIILGNHSFISERTCFGAHNGGRIIVGENNYFSSNNNIVCLKEIVIGDNNLFGQNVIVIDHNHCYSNKNQLICKQGYNCQKIIIGSDCWFCANVVVCKGVTIGNHIVVGANSVVDSDLLTPGVYAGAPAKLIRKIL